MRLFLSLALGAMLAGLLGVMVWAAEHIDGFGVGVPR